jgi:methylated-DNA-protein-cysteine methyltransferase-like protein
MMERFSARVISLIAQIPPGKVMTYGQIAAVAGNPRGARQVSRILHSCSEKYSLPWHRVINARFQVSLPGEEQTARLQAEGLIFDGRGRVDPRVALFTGPFS